MIVKFPETVRPKLSQDKYTCGKLKSQYNRIEDGLKDNTRFSTYIRKRQGVLGGK